MMGSCAFAAGVDERIDIGSRTADAAMRRLKSSLMEAIAKAGSPEKTIPFGHVAALPLTVEEISGKVVDVRRATLKARNPTNQANENEAAVLRRWTAIAERGEKIPAFETAEEGNFLHYYRPLKVEPMCLTCHGAESSLSPGVRKELKKQYPSDRATGYKAGDLRGLIHVIVKK